MTYRSESKLIDIYGHCVAIPNDLVFNCKPAVSDRYDEIELTTSVGGLKNYDFRFELDSLVALEFAEKEVSVCPLEDIGPNTLEHYLIDHAIPHALTLAGKYVFHAAGLCSALENGKKEKGVMIVGASGQGKSTTTAFLLNNGWKLLADDGLRVSTTESQCVMYPSYPSVRLNADVVSQVSPSNSHQSGIVAEYSEKIRVDVDAALYQSTRTPIEYLIELGDDAPFSWHRLRPSELCVSLAKNLFHPPSSPVEAVNRLDQVAPYTTLLSGCKVNFERSMQGLEQLAQFLHEIDSV